MLDMRMAAKCSDTDRHRGAAPWSTAQEDDITVTATIPVMNNDHQSHGAWNCCVAIQQLLQQLRGLRASDLDQLQRRQKAAEWSNVISEGPDWSSCASESGALSTANLSDAFNDAAELANFDDIDDWRDIGGEEEERSLTVRSNASAESTTMPGGGGGGGAGSTGTGGANSSHGCKAAGESQQLAAAPSPSAACPGNREMGRGDQRVANPPAAAPYVERQV